MAALSASERGTLCSTCEESIAPDAFRNVKARRIYCRECWMHWIELKFRKQLFSINPPEKGSTGQVFQPPETLVVHFDGSPSALALINLLHRIQQHAENRENSSNRPFQFTFVILVILESESISAGGGSGGGGPGVYERQKKTLKALESWSNAVGRFPIVASSPENYLDDGNGPLDLLFLLNEGKHAEGFREKAPISISSVGIDGLTTPFSPSAHDVLETFVTKVKNDMMAKSQLNDVLGIIRMNAVVGATKLMKCDKLLVSEDQSTIATKAFTMAANLRGYQMADEMAFRAVIGGMTVIRPLWDLLSEDLIQYLNCLPEQYTKGLYNPPKVKSGSKKKVDTVDDLCTEFIRGLQTALPSTVPTVARIGDKIRKRCPPREEFNDDASFKQAWANVTLCTFCQRAITPKFTGEKSVPHLCEACFKIHSFAEMYEIIKLSKLSSSRNQHIIENTVIDS